MAKTIDLYRAFNWLLALLLFSLPVSEALKQVFIYPLILLGLVMIFKYKLKPSYNALFISVVAYCVFFIISDIINFQSFLDPLRCALLFGVVACFDYKKIDMKLLIIALCLGYIIAFGMGLYKLLVTGSAFFELKSIGHVNTSAIYSFFILIIISCFMKYQKINKYFSVFIIILSFSGVVLSGSRTCIYMLPLFFILGAIFIFGVKFQVKDILATLGAGLFFVLLTFLLAQAPYENNGRITQKITKGVATGTIEEGAEKRETRLPVWGTAIQVWAKNPFFGIGHDNFKDINISVYYPDTTEPKVPHAHNMVLNLLANNGIFVALSYIIIQLSAFILFFKYYKDSALIMASIFLVVFSNIFAIVELTFYKEHLILLLVFFALSLVKIKELKKQKA